MTLAFFRATDTHLKKKNFKNLYLGVGGYCRYKDVIAHSHEAWNGLTGLKGIGDLDLDLRKKVKTP